MTGIGPAAPRPGEVAVDLPSTFEADVFFIGRIRTPWTERKACPRRGDPERGPICQVEVDERWWPALDGLAAHATLELLYWMHQARRDLVRQNPKSRGTLFGTFALRSPNRPNPLGSSTVALLGAAAGVLTVRGLDCLDGTPLIDIKPSRCPMWTERQTGGE